MEEQKYKYTAECLWRSVLLHDMFKAKPASTKQFLKKRIYVKLIIRGMSYILLFTFVLFEISCSGNKQEKPSSSVEQEQDTFKENEDATIFDRMLAYQSETCEYNWECLDEALAIYGKDSNWTEPYILQLDKRFQTYGEELLGQLWGWESYLEWRKYINWSKGRYVQSVLDMRHIPINIHKEESLMQKSLAATLAILDTIVDSMGSGTYSQQAYANVSIFFYDQMALLIDGYYAISQNQQLPNKWKQIPASQFTKTFIALDKTKAFDHKQCILLKNEIDNWILYRQSIASKLQDEHKTCYNNISNRLQFQLLRMIKNQFEEFLCHGEEAQEVLLPTNCTYDELIRSAGFAEEYNKKNGNN